MSANRKTTVETRFHGDATPAVSILSYQPNEYFALHSRWPGLVLVIAGSSLGASPHTACTLILAPPGLLIRGMAGADGMRCMHLELESHSHPVLSAGRIHVFRGGEATRWALSIYWALQGNPKRELDDDSKRCEALYNWVVRDRMAATKHRPPAWLQLVLDRLDQGYVRPPQVKDLAVIAQVDPCHLARTFKKFMHCTIGQHIRQLRLEDALRQILTNKSRRLAEIAATTGFADQAHFTRTFKQEIGLTPRDYRRRFRSAKTCNMLSFQASVDADKVVRSSACNH